MRDPLLVDELRLRRFARLAAPLLRGKATQGIGPRAARNRAGAGLEFLDLRRYAPGEDVRHVDWRHSARRRQLLVRRYRDESASDWLLAVDGSASMSVGDKWPLAARLATALSYALLYAGNRVAVAVFAERLRAWCVAGRGRRQFAAILRKLSDYSVLDRGGASMPGLCAERASRTGHVVVLSDFLREDAMLDDLRRIRGSVSGASAIQVIDDADCEPGTIGTATMFDIEIGAERRAEIDTGSSAQAVLALKRHSDRLRDGCGKLGMRLSQCRPDAAWDRVLLAHLGG